MKVSKFRNIYYVIEAEEEKILTTVEEPLEGEERLYSKKIFVGKYDSIDNYKEIDESEIIFTTK